MTRDLKTLGLALLAMLATSAVASSAAQAAPGELHAEVAVGKTSAVLTGLNVTVHKITVKGFVLECQIAELEGTIAKTTTDITLTPEYEGCKYGGVEAEVIPNGCKFTLTGAANFTANLDITGCTTGKSIEIVDPICTITIPEQKNLSHVVYTNKGVVPKDIEASSTVTGVTYIGEGALCGQANGHHADGTFSGTTTIAAYEDEGLLEPVQIDGHQFQPFKVGAQVGLFAT